MAQPKPSNAVLSHIEREHTAFEKSHTPEIAARHGRSIHPKFKELAAQHGRKL